MPSPFPGMNPYLEHPSVWPGFHTRYIAALATTIGDRVRPGYFVEIGEHIYLRELPDEPRQRVGDADVSIHPQPGGSAVAVAGRVQAPAFAYQPPAVERVRYLEVRDRRDRETVTVIELLSRSNKYAGPDREQYLGKRNTLLATRTNFIELDLLRAGPRMDWDQLPGCDYYAVVSRPADRPRVDCWPVHLRDPLPEIPIPLRPGEPEPLVSLQGVLHRVYDDAFYADRVYDDTPDPRLSAEDAAWAQSLIPAAG